MSWIFIVNDLALENLILSAEDIYIEVLMYFITKNLISQALIMLSQILVRLLIVAVGIVVYYQCSC